MGSLKFEVTFNRIFRDYLIFFLFIFSQGTINLLEFANACKIIFLDQNETISDEAIKSMIEAMDSNKDGKIDLAEFTQAFVIYT